MKIVKVNDLQGGEILAKPILTDDCQVVIGKGAIIKESYIEKKFFTHFSNEKIYNHYFHP